MVSTMADQIYGIHQSQPFDVFSYMKANGRRLNLVGRFSYLPNLLAKSGVGLQNGMDLIISDKIAYYDEPMMNGQTRRYAKIKGFLADYSPTKAASASLSDIQLVEDEIIRLGYTDLKVILSTEDAAELATALGIATSRLGLVMKAAEVFEIRAGVPTYTNDPYSVMDAPYDGTSYIRLNGEWIQDDHLTHAVIDGGTATLEGVAPSSPSPTPSPSSVLFNFTPSYTFDGSGYDASHQNYTYGEEPCDTFGIEKIDIANSFLTIYFKTTANRLSWSAVDRSVDIQSIAGSYDWEGAQALSSATTYSTNTSSNYIHYQLGLTSSQKGELADFVSSSGAGNAVITLELS